MDKLTNYLMKYYHIQDKIMLVYRPTLKSNWACRCLFLSDKYEPNIAYNHRSILSNEIVMEWDDDNEVLNRKYADIVSSRLRKDNLKVAKWRSGNKSIHLHCFVNFKTVGNISLFKKVFMKHYCY